MIGEAFAAFERVLLREGSTRGVALLRILLVFVAWSRWANELLLLRDLSTPRMLLTVAFFVTTSWLLVGWYTRVAAAATAAVMCAIVFGFGRWGGVEDWTHHHTTIIAYAYVGLALTPCGGSLSLDRWLELRAAERQGRPPAPERGELWGVIVLGILMSTVYFWSAFDKTTVAFLGGDRLEQIFVDLYVGSEWSSPQWARFGFSAMGISVVVLEYLLAIGLWFRSLQRWLFPLGLLLHGVFYVLIPVYTFTITMWALYLVYVDPDELHAWIDRMLGAPASARDTSGRSGGSTP